MSQIKDPAERFGDRVKDYIRARPSYPTELVDWLEERCGFNPGQWVADMGAGTGIWSKQMLERGYRVYGIEPNPPMRQAADALLSSYPDFISRDTKAEASGLEDQSVHHITCMQAFHWLNRDSAAAEFRRILKPNGRVILGWNDRQTNSTRFLQEYEQFLLDHSTDYRKVNHKNVDGKAVKDFFGGRAPLSRIFPNIQDLDWEGLEARVFSSSYIPGRDDPAYPAISKALRKLFERHEAGGRVSIVYDTLIYSGRW